MPLKIAKGVWVSFDGCYNLVLDVTVKNPVANRENFKEFGVKTTYHSSLAGLLERALEMMVNRHPKLNNVVDKDRKLMYKKEIRESMEKKYGDIGSIIRMLKKYKEELAEGAKTITVRALMEDLEKTKKEAKAIADAAKKVKESESK